MGNTQKLFKSDPQIKSQKMDQKNQINQQSKHGTIPKSVIVIGAGISGAAAAKTLTEKGFNVTVVEGRNRVGGRIYTDYKTLSAQTEVGAHWIHGTKGNPISKLVKESQVEVKKTNYDNDELYDSNG